MLVPLADALAATGRCVISYDRRGTGGSGRTDWPGVGADQQPTTITRRPFTSDELAGLDVTIAINTAPNAAVAPAAAALAELIGTTPLVVDTHLHEIHLVEPTVLAEVDRNDGPVGGDEAR